MGLLADLRVKVGADISGFKSGMAAVHRDLQAAQPMAFGMALGVGAAGAALGALGVKAVGMAAKMEQSRIAFTTLLGSAEAADSFIRQLQAFAASTPFEFVGLQDNAKRLMAMGFAAKDVIPVLTNVGDAVSALGSGQQGIDLITYALGQMSTAGKVHTQDMMQLTNAGIAAWDMLAKHLGITVAEAQDEVSKGAVSSQQGLDAIMTGMHSRYSGLMEKQSHTVTGLFSNLQDIAAQSLTVIGDKLVGTFNIKDKIAGLTETLQRVTADFKKGGFRGILYELVAPEALDPALAKVGRAFHALSEAVGKVGGAIQRAFSGVAAKLFGPDGAGFWEHLDVAIVAVAGVIGGIFVTALAALAVAAWAAMAPFLPFVAVIAAVAVAAYLIYTNWAQIEGFFAGLWNRVKEATIGAWNSILGFFGTIGATVGGVFNALGTTIHDAIGGVLAWVGANWPFIVGALLGPIGIVAALIYTHWEQIKGTFGAGVAAVLGLLSSAWDGIKAGAMAVFNFLLNWYAFWFAAILSLFGVNANQLVANLAAAWNAIRAGAVAVWNGLTGWLGARWADISSAAGAAWAAISGAISGGWNAASGATFAAWSAISGWLAGKWTEISAGASAAWYGMAGIIGSAWAGISGVVMGQANALGGWLYGKWAEITGAATGAWNGLVGAAWDIFGRVAAAIRGALSGIHIPLPHITQTGSHFVGIGDHGFDVPDVGISWWARGAIFTRPTLFGKNGVGEAGPEAVLPIADLPRYLPKPDLSPIADALEALPRAFALELARVLSERGNASPAGRGDLLAALQRLLEDASYDRSRRLRSVT